MSKQEEFNEAIKQGKVEKVKALLKDKRHNVSPSYYDNWPIGFASFNGHVEIVKVLLKDKRVDPSDKENIAIRLASMNGHLEIVKALLKDSRVDPSDDDNCAIRWATSNGKVEVPEMLVGGSGSSKIQRGVTVETETVKAKFTRLSLGHQI